jgi:hypothetical protein
VKLPEPKRTTDDWRNPGGKQPEWLKSAHEETDKLILVWDEPFGQMWVCSCGRFVDETMAIINQHDAFKKKSGIRKVPVNNSSFFSTSSTTRTTSSWSC